MKYYFTYLGPGFKKPVQGIKLFGSGTITELHALFVPHSHFLAVGTLEIFVYIIVEISHH